MRSGTLLHVRRLFAVLLVNLVLLVCLLEIGALAVCYVRDGKLFYTTERVQSELVPSRFADVPNNVLHPVLGFIRPPGLPITVVASRERLDGLVGAGVTPGWLSRKANNFGFFSDRDYPFGRDERKEYLIGIFGGSVGHWFALQGAKRLEDRLQSSGVLKDRHPRILNFAQGAFKQPQQLQTLCYFLARGQPFDFVVNIDGFNEVALSYLNLTSRVDPSLPSGQQLLPIIALLGGASASSEYLEALTAVNRKRRTLVSIGQWDQHNRSAAVHLLLEQFRAMVVRSYWQSVRSLDALAARAKRTPLIHVNEVATDGFERGDEEVFEQFAGLWAHSSSLMKQLLAGLGIPYLHVLQPNQYYTKRTFGSAEQALALDARSSYALPAAKGYPYLLARLPALRKEGVLVFSAVDIFDSVSQPVYADSCCHYNQLGNEILADFIADRLIGALVVQDAIHSAN